MRPAYIPPSLAHRGALHEAFLMVERGRWRPRPAYTPYRVEVQETRSCGQYDPGGREGCRPTPQGIPDNGKHGHGPQNRHVERREASVSIDLETRASRTKTPRAGHGAQIRVPRRHSCARRRSPPPRGVEKEVWKEKGDEEDEVGNRGDKEIKIVGWVERRGSKRGHASNVFCGARPNTPGPVARRFRLARSARPNLPNAGWYRCAIHALNDRDERSRTC